MNNFFHYARGAMLLSFGQIVSYLFSFIRNVILARTLTKADFALAAVFSLMVSLLELSSRISLGRQIIQAQHGSSDSFQRTSHAFQFLLAVIGTILVIATSYPAALAFKVPKLTWAFALLALIPLARGFEHLDNYRCQRELNYMPIVLCETIPQVLVTIIAWPLTIWLQDFRVILWIMIAKATLSIGMSHLVATRPYRWAWDKQYTRNMWVFGWPLLLNGLFLFASQQADQAVVGSFLSLESLAVYALALSLVSVPWAIFSQVGSSLMLPILSRAQNDFAQFRHHYCVCIEHAAICSVFLLLPLIVGGEQIVTFIFGHKYAGTGQIVSLLGAASALRFLRFAPANASMAKADTMNHLFSNIWRCLSLPLAVCTAILGGGVTWIAAVALLAELLASLMTFLRLRSRQGVPLKDSLGPFLFLLGFIGAGIGLVCVGAFQWGNWAVGTAISLLLALAFIISLFVFPSIFRLFEKVTKRFLLSAAQSESN